MANLENNYDKEKKDKSVSKKVDDALHEAAHFAHDMVEHPVDTMEAVANKAKKKWWARALLTIFWVGFSLFVLFLIVINLNVTKQYLANKALGILNKDFHTGITTESIEINFFGDVTIKGLKAKDHKGLEFIKAKEFKANTDWIGLVKDAVSKTNHFGFDGLTLKDADIKIITYKGDSIANIIRYFDNFSSGKARDPKAPVFQLDSRVEIYNSKISVVNQNSEGEAGKWLDATNFNLKAPSFQLKGGDIQAQINQLTFVTERWGKKHFVETFSTNLDLNKDFLLLKETTINTDHSLLQGDIKFNLKDNSWAGFADNVKWEMELARGSQVSGYDISYFVTNWDNYATANISGKMDGTLNDFQLQNFVIGDRQVAINTDKINFKDLLKGNFNIKTDRLSTDFTYIDLKAMLPTFISDKMKNFADDFGRLKFTGAVEVTPEEVYVPAGDLVTGIGQAKINELYLNDYSTNLPKYRGHAIIQNLNTSVITKNPQVGLVSGDFNFDGESFDVNTMRIKTQSRVSRIDILNKELNNIVLDGFLDYKTYKGLITINDEQAKAKLNGFINFKTSRIEADVNTDIQYLNINYFSGEKGTQILKGKIDGKVAMSNLNDMNLDASVQQLELISGTQKYAIPTAKVKAYFEGGERIVFVDAPGTVKGKITGKFNLNDLQGMVQNGLEKVLITPSPRMHYRGQRFNLDFEIYQGLINYFLPDLNISGGSTIHGAYNGDTNNLQLDLMAPYVKYFIKREIEGPNDLYDELTGEPVATPSKTIVRDSAMIENILVNINTEDVDNQIFAKVGRLVYAQNVFKNVTLKGNNENNQLLHLGASFEYGTLEQEQDNQLKTYAINLNQSYDANGDYVFRFEPTSVKLNDIIWQIDTSSQLNHRIVYRKKTKDFLVENLRIYSDDSSLLLSNARFKSAEDYSAEGKVENFDLSKLFAMQETGNSLGIKGVANGEFSVKKVDKMLNPLVNLQVKDIYMQDRSLGNINLVIKDTGVANIYSVDGRVESAGIIGKNSLEVTGTVNNNTESPTLDIKADMDDFDLAFSNQFVKGVFSNIRGKANGILNITGPLNNIDYNGDIGLSDVGLKLDFTGVDYTFADNTINLYKGLAILNNIGVNDGRENSKGTISGAIRFETLASMEVNLIMRVDNLMLLNTTQSDFDLFWGRVYGEGDLYVSGPVSSLDISTPNMRSLYGSTFTFNSGSTSGVEEFKMLRFLKEDQSGEIVAETKKKSGVNMNIDLTAMIDKGTTVNVFVGESLGDITVRGNSNALRFRMTRQGNIYMDGKYQVDNGTFVSKFILERTFQIAKGSSMNWDGNAMTPDLNIIANYQRVVTNIGDYLNAGSLPPVDVLLTTNITGKLNNPQIEFNITAPELSGQLKDALASKLSEGDERVYQFGSVLLLNSFNVQSSGGVKIDAGQSAEASGYNILFRQLGSVLNTLSDKFKIDLSYAKSDEASNTSGVATSKVSYIVSSRVTLKGSLGIPISGSSNTNNNYLTGEGTVEYDYSKNNDGSRIIRVFSKPSNIGLVNGNSTGSAGENQAYGVGAVWTKNFDTLFKRKKKNKKTKNDSTEVKKDSIIIIKD